MSQVQYRAWERTTKPRMSTNDAQALASEKLKALGMDLDRLNRDHSIRIVDVAQKPSTKGKVKQWESPACRIEWRRDRGRLGPVAVRVIVYRDVRKIAHLEINDPSYIQRRWIEIP
jgi:hypothetical protein